MTRWVCFNDPAWKSSGWGGVVWWVGNIPTTFIQIAGAGSIIKIIFPNIFHQNLITFLCFLLNTSVFFIPVFSVQRFLVFTAIFISRISLATTELSLASPELSLATPELSLATPEQKGSLDAVWTVYTFPLRFLSTRYPMTGALEVILVQVMGMVDELVHV